MLNNLILVTVTPFSGTTSTDKNGKFPVMLQCLAGVMPNRNVLSGTVAERAGFEVGKTYLANVRELGVDQVFGPAYTFIKVMECKSAEDIAKAQKALGDPEILTVLRPAGFDDSYVRKTNAVEGFTSKRIQSGDFIPAIQTTSRDHSTAEKILQGSSTDQLDYLKKLDLEHASDLNKREES